MDAKKRLIWRWFTYICTQKATLDRCLLLVVDRGAKPGLFRGCDTNPPSCESCITRVVCEGRN